MNFGDEAAERIGDTEREAAVAALRTHLEQGRLDGTGFEDRQVRASRAQTWGDLVPLFADLPEPRPAKVTALAAYGSPGRPVPAAGPLATAAGNPAVRALPNRVRETIMALTPFAALLLFFSGAPGGWLWFLAIPIMGILLYGPEGKPKRDRDRR